MRHLLFVLALLVILFLSPHLSADSMYQPPPGTQPVYFLMGTPYEMGYQYGTQAADQILVTRDATRVQVLKRYSPDALNEILDKYDQAIRRDLPDFDSAGFIQGIVDGMTRSGYQVSYRDIVMLHNQIGLLYYPNITDNGMCTLFSAIDNTEGGPIVGANYDMQNGLVSAYFGTIVAYPSDGIPFISTANAGKLANSLVLNEKGVLLGVAKSMQTTKENKTVYSVNTALSAPAILMHSENASDAEKKMESISVPFGLNHLIVDTDGDAYVVERIGNLTGVRRSGDNGEDGYLIVTNHFLTPVMKEVQIPWDPKIGYPSSYFRYITAEKLILNPDKRVDISKGMRILSNTSYYNGTVWFDKAAFTGNTINRFESFGGTLQSEVVDLKNRTLYVCSGNPYAPEWNRLAPDQTGEYVKVPLRSSPDATTREIRSASLDQMQKTAIAIGSITENNRYNGYLLNSWYDEVKQDFWEAEFALLNASTVTDQNMKLQIYSKAATGYAKVQAKAQYITRSSGGLVNSAPEIIESEAESSTLSPSIIEPSRITQFNSGFPAQVGLAAG